MKTSLALLTLGMILAACSGGPAPSMQTAGQPAATPSPGAAAPNETAALTAITKIKEAQATYFKLNRRYALTYEELVEAHLLNTEPSPSDTGYEFKLRPAADAQTYKLSVVPTASTPAVRHFLTDETGVIHAEEGKDATAESPKYK